MSQLREIRPMPSLTDFQSAPWGGHRGMLARPGPSVAAMFLIDGWWPIAIESIVISER